jgi:hypothetical protein
VIGVLGDIDGGHGVGVGATQGQFLPGDHDDPGVRRPTLRGDRLDRRPGWSAGGAGPAEAAGLVVGQWLGRVRTGSGAERKPIRPHCQASGGTTQDPTIACLVRMPGSR